MRPSGFPPSAEETHFRKSYGVREEVPRMRDLQEVERNIHQQLPANFAEEARNLGAFVEHFRTSVGAWRYIGVIPFVGLGVLGLLGPALVLPKQAGVADAVAFLLIGSAFIGAAVAIYLYVRWLRRMQAWLFADGLVAATASRTVAWRWDQLALIRQKIVTQIAGGTSALEAVISSALQDAIAPSGGWIVLTLQSTDGTQIRLSGLQHANRLVEAIARETLPWLLPPARARYDSGATVFFSRLGLSSQGLHDGADVLPWGEVQDVKLADTSVTITKKGKWLSWSKVPLAGIANVHVFFALVREVQSRK
jgi:hypothetical protein